MGWSVTIHNFEGHSPRTEGSWPHEGVLGAADFVREAIGDALAQVDWSNPYRGVLTDRHCTLEFVLGREPVLHRFAIHITGNSSALPLLAHLCMVNGWAAYDPAQQQFIDFEQRLRRVRSH